MSLEKIFQFRSDFPREGEISRGRGKFPVVQNVNIIRMNIVMARV